MLDSAWIKPAVERAVKTAIQVVLALFVTGVTVADIDWRQAALVAGTAALVSLLTSAVSAPFGPDGSPSLVEDPNAGE